MEKNKSRGPRRVPFSARRVAVRETFPRFLIVCEGEKTEPNYFKSFRVSGVILEVSGIGQNTVGLVQEAVQRRTGGDYDQVWCVFDRDSFPPQNFNAALSLAQNEGISVAYSNEAFELWYVLHFDFLNTGVGRRDYVTKLEQHIGRKYEKNSRGMYDLLEPAQETAIKNARTLLGIYDPPRPADDNPSTTVHLLVEELRKFSR